MSIPPFPAQDLAKLVLGYLAEEQLMTAYDEFLQASPYLDAFRNEYDRILMTSLKNILAEYWAVKIYVQSCKPILLRRHLFGCSNLLEVVKFLIQNIDINKINVQDASIDKSRCCPNNSTTPVLVEATSQQDNLQAPQHVDYRNSSFEARNPCAVCNSIQLPSCVCKSRCRINNVTTSTSHVDSSMTETSAELSALDAGSVFHTPKTRRRKVKCKEANKTQVIKTQNRLESDSTSKPQDALSVDCSESNIMSSEITPATNSQDISHSINFSVGTTTLESAQKIEEFNNILNVVCNQNKKNSDANTFHEFATGIGGGENAESSIASGNLSLPRLAPKMTVPNNLVAGTCPTKSIFLNFGKQGKIELNPALSPQTAQRIFPDIKSNEQRITILSNIKVHKGNRENAPPVLKNATSTPTMQMQTILINGTPAYKPAPQVNTRCNYTKAEIMAMPTLILVPTTAPAHIPRNILPKTTTARDTNLTTSTISSSTHPLGPLVIDMPSQSPAFENSNVNVNNALQENYEKHQNNIEMLVKTVDFKNVSAPKDSESDTNKSTPQFLPPLRKSSSTPRRTSHVRVLDFTTPRRILEDTINEHAAEEGNVHPEEILVSKSPCLQSHIKSASKENNAIVETDKQSACIDSNSSGFSKENQSTNKVVPQRIIPVKGKNWDADLRALVVTNENDYVSRPKPKPTRKKKLSTKVETPSAQEEMNPNEKNKPNKNKVCKNKEKKDGSEELVEVVKESQNVPVKPNINIITGSEWSNNQDDKNQNKCHEEKQTDTPEMERLSLQNALGAKLNISELLETPYKQALYDIQMETPRFLGPDIPYDPLSDIKIMNIPTPRFLNTPKPIQTPSSYSSRPTDYSSGGSYYKPDEDYISPDLAYPEPPLKETYKTKAKEQYIPPDLAYPEPPQKETNKTKAKEQTVKKQMDNKIDKCKTTEVTSRPVRKCTKNVSYYNSPIVNKTKQIDEVASSCSESASVTSPVNSAKSAKGNKTKTRSKSDSKRKSITTKNRKTSVTKETPKSFMKIKPRKCTPTKEIISGKYRKKTPDSHTRKKNQKDKNISATPVVTDIPTKSRRKSSTPRKLHCTKSFNSESSGHNSPDIISINKTQVTRESSVSCPQESDTEQLQLRWSDDGSQDIKSKESQKDASVVESDDISQIKEYIKNTETICSHSHPESDLQIDLVNRGFDAETAKIIERDLLDSPSQSQSIVTIVGTTIQAQEPKECVTNVESDKNIASSNCNLNAQEEVEEDKEDEIEFSVCECNEESNNYITYCHDDTVDLPKKDPSKLKDNFNMEICIDDGLIVRLRATPFTVMLDQDPIEMNIIDEEMEKETEMAVNSISNINKLYTPLKDTIRTQCYEIFDSTLTSLDTPLKATSPSRECEAEIVLEVEKIEMREKVESKKRKRLHSAEVPDDLHEIKKSKPETQYLLNSTNIQNIDIETVLSKLHGP